MVFFFRLFFPIVCFLSSFSCLPPRQEFSISPSKAQAPVSISPTNFSLLTPNASVPRFCFKMFLPRMHVLTTQQDISPCNTHSFKPDFSFLLRGQQTYHIAPGFSCGNHHLMPPTHFTFRWALFPVHCISPDYVSPPTWRLSLLFNRTSLHFSIPIKKIKSKPKDPSALRKIKEGIFLHEIKAISTCLISKHQPVHSFKSPACPLTQMIAKMPFQTMVSGCAGHWHKIRV